MEHDYMTADRSVYQVLQEHAKQMRKEPTESESALWRFLSTKQLGYRFRRQHIIDEYIVDFVCLKKRLIIEIDGKYHNAPLQRELDEQRSLRLQDLGYTIIRFTNEQVTCDIENTLIEIKKHLL